MTRWRFLLAPAFGAIASTACGSGAGNLGEVGTYNDGGGNFGGSGSDAGAPGSLQASITPSSASVCPGQCADLAASAAGGVAPYTYAWTAGVTGSTAMQHVCPTQTTTYSVTATDSSGHGGELAASAAKASTSTTVTVTPSCANPEGGATTTAQEICSARWTTLLGSAPDDPASELLAAPALVATDATGAMLVATTSAQPIDGGNELYVAELRKYDATCHLVWDKTFQTTAGNTRVDIEGLTTDASNNIVFTGAIGGAVDFGSGPVNPFAQLVPIGVYVAKLGPDGSGAWTHLYAVNSLSYVPNSLAIDPQGNVLLLLGGYSGADLGAGPIGLPIQVPELYQAELSAAGAYVAGIGLSWTGGYVPALAVTGPHAYVLGGLATTAVTWSGGQTTATNDQPYMASFGANMAYQWSTVIPSTLLGPFLNNSPLILNLNARIEIGAANDIFLAYGAGTQLNPDDDAGTNAGPLLAAHGLAKSSPSGSLLWTDEADFAGDALSAFVPYGIDARNVSLDSMENALVGDDVQNGTNGWDVRIRRVGSTSGHVEAAETWGTSGPEHLLATGIDPQGHSVILVAAADAPTGAPLSLVLAKLGW
jgi:hypothetical protein